jgi:hypothetical protein
MPSTITAESWSRKATTMKAGPACSNRFDATRLPGDQPGIAFVLDALSELALEEGRAERSVRLAAAADGMRESLGAQAPSFIIGEWDAREAVRGLIPEGAVAAAWAEGRTMGLERVLTYAEGDADG